MVVTARFCSVPALSSWSHQRLRLDIRPIEENPAALRPGIARPARRAVGKQTSGRQGDSDADNVQAAGPQRGPQRVIPLPPQLHCGAALSAPPLKFFDGVLGRADALTPGMDQFVKTERSSLACTSAS